LNAIPLPESWLPELLRAGAADLCLSRMASPQAERPFSVASFDCVRFCCGRAGVAPQALVDHKALPPPPVLGYSNTLFFVSSVPSLEKLSAIPVSRFWGALHQPRDGGGSLASLRLDAGDPDVVGPLGALLAVLHGQRAACSPTLQPWQHPVVRRSTASASSISRA
jgi:hypothetical protein